MLGPEQTDKFLGLWGHIVGSINPNPINFSTKVKTITAGSPRILAQDMWWRKQIFINYVDTIYIENEKIVKIFFFFLIKTFLK